MSYFQCPPSSLVFLAVLTVACVGSGLADEPVLDGYFTEWSEQLVLAKDAVGDAQGAFDLSTVSALTRGTTLYVCFDTGKVVNLQNGEESDGTLQILFELPGNRHLTIDFRKRTAVLRDEPTRQISWEELKFACLPTYANNRHELRLDLSHFGVKQGDVVRVQFDGSDRLDAPIEIQVNGEVSQRSPKPLRSHDAALRIANLNTYRQGLDSPERCEAIGRLLAAASADVYCFQEEWEEDRFRRGAEARIPSLDAGRLNLHWSNGCGIATHLPLEPLPIDLDRGAAAIVHAANKPVVVFSVHFKCCGYAESSEDKLRVGQAEQLAATITKLRTGQMGDRFTGYKDAAIVVIGDYNLVGSRRPLDLLIGKDGPGLQELVSRSLEDGSTITWRGGPESSFWPGRLDYVTYSHEGVRSAEGFVVDSASLPDAQRTELLLQPSDSEASDHLMLVADFELAQ